MWLGQTHDSFFSFLCVETQSIGTAISMRHGYIGIITIYGLMNDMATMVMHTNNSKCFIFAKPNWQILEPPPIVTNSA